MKISHKPSHLLQLEAGKYLVMPNGVYNYQVNYQYFEFTIFIYQR